MPKKIISFSKKKKSTIKRYVDFYGKMVKAGKNISQVKRMNIKQYNKTFNTTITNNRALDAQKKYLLKQVERDLDKITSLYLEKEGIEAEGLKKSYFQESRKQFNIKDEKEELIENLNEIKSKPIHREGMYGVVKLTDLGTDNEYFFKYTNEKNLEKEINTRLVQYNISNYYTELLGIYMYKAHVTKEFKKEMSKI